MKLIVNSEGVYLSKVGECFCLKKDGQKQEISAKNVDFENKTLTISAIVDSVVIIFAEIT